MTMHQTMLWHTGNTSGVVLHLYAQLRLQAPLERDSYSEAKVPARLELIVRES
jgi:hypothetical protein